jgi:hypothetical protein
VEPRGPEAEEEGLVVAIINDLLDGKWERLLEISGQQTDEAAVGNQVCLLAGRSCHYLHVDGDVEMASCPLVFVH